MLSNVTSCRYFLGNDVSIFVISCDMSENVMMYCKMLNAVVINYCDLSQKFLLVSKRPSWLFEKNQKVS